MRKSLEDLSPSMVRKVDDYPGLPAELAEYSYWIADSGYSIMAIPEVLLRDHFGDMELWEYEVPMPTRYVLEKGYRFFEGYVVVQAEYDREMGLVIDDECYEY